MASRSVPVLALLLCAASLAAANCTSTPGSGDDDDSATSSSSSSGAAVSSSSTEVKESSSAAATTSSSAVPASSSAAPSSSAAGTSSSAVGSSTSQAQGGSSSMEMPSSGLPFDLDGGLPFELDAGITPYVGTPEPGVKCSGTVCDADAGTALCCVGLTSSCAASCSFALPVACDGPEDCQDTQVCCLGLTSGTSCVAPEECVGSGMSQKLVVCNRDLDCPNGSTCGQSSLVTSYLTALDMGACMGGMSLP